MTGSSPDRMQHMRDVHAALPPAMSDHDTARALRDLRRARTMLACTDDPVKRAESLATIRALERVLCIDVPGVARVDHRTEPKARHYKGRVR